MVAKLTFTWDKNTYTFTSDVLATEYEPAANLELKTTNGITNFPFAPESVPPGATLKFKKKEAKS